MSGTQMLAEAARKRIAIAGKERKSVRLTFLECRALVEDGWVTDLKAEKEVPDEDEDGDARPTWMW